MNNAAAQRRPALTHSPLAIAALITNAAIWGLSWIAFRYLDVRGVHSLWATGMMYSVVVVGIIAVMWLKPSKDESASNIPLKSQWMALICLLVSAGVTNSAFNWAVTIGDVVRTVLLFYLMPVWTLLLARWFLKESLTVAAWFRIALCLIGAALVLTPPGKSIGVPLPSSLADMLGLLGGMGFAATNVALRAATQNNTPTRQITLALFVGGALLPTLLAVILTLNQSIKLPPVPNPAWIGAVLMLAAAFLVGNLALQYGAARLPASIIAAVMPSEVVFASVSAAWLAGEALTPQLLIGGCLILAAAVLSMFDPTPKESTS
jgi:drug/metabolite transporter (DMT)-like permease